MKKQPRTKLEAGRIFGSLRVLPGDPIRRYRLWWYTCKCRCGTTRTVKAADLLSGRIRSCDKVKCDRRAGTKSVQLAPHVFLNANGYVVEYANGRPKLQHRRLMEEHIGRALLRQESVHHKNGVRHDNRMENLELWTKSHPPGQRVVDKISWAKELLRLYESNPQTANLSL